MSETSEQLWEHKFWKNRRGEAVNVALRRFASGPTVIDIRVHYTAADGTLKPTKAGVCLAVRKLPELHRAITKALGAVADLGLGGATDEAAE